MIKKLGYVDLPLHGGKCPPWLFEKMVRLSRAVLLFVYQEFGSKELIRRITDPLWFQAFGCFLGFDWHSSGLTTTVGVAIKEALKPNFKDLKIYVCGGKGKTGLKTPQEIDGWGEKHGFASRAEEYITLSRLVARIDNNAIQDGFQLYFHLMVFSLEGYWGVIQQGMDEKIGYARRYHWYSEKIVNFFENPHSGIVSDIRRKEVLNLVDRESERMQRTLIKLLREDLDRVWKEVRSCSAFIFKRDHSLTHKDLSYNSLKKIWETTYRNPPQNFKDLLLTPGMGAKALRALTLASELIYDIKASRRDPVAYSYAHGGKDGHPYRLDKKLYEATIRQLEEILAQIRISDSKKVEIFRKLPQLLGI